LKASKSVRLEAIPIDDDKESELVESRKSKVAISLLELEAKSDQKPLAKPIYHLLKDSQIKEKLKELNLSTKGSREVLISMFSGIYTFRSCLLNAIPNMYYFITLK
jgi:hypothetical protein